MQLNLGDNTPIVGLMSCIFTMFVSIDETSWNHGFMGVKHGKINQQWLEMVTIPPMVKSEVTPHGDAC